MPFLPILIILLSEKSYGEKMQRRKVFFFLLGCMSLTNLTYPLTNQKEWLLPRPSSKGKTSVEEAIFQRKACRTYQKTPLSLEEISQLLWAAAGKTIDGITGPTRSHPSAGGLYPVEIYLVAGNILSLPQGIYHYQWWNHSLFLLKEGDFRPILSQMALGQQALVSAPVVCIFTAVYERTTKKYGKRGERYVPLDIGASAQNMSLQAEAIGLGSVWIGAFDEEKVKKLLETQDREPLLLLPLGKPAR